ncbi:MAG: hypothetical protein FWE89_03210 [Syntrophaceae bacterium]|nr:hypothetical protein [Syntrophaceae bacterium]
MKPSVLTEAEVLPLVAVPEGYSGKVLLLAVTAGSHSWTILRSGGRWHRDILRACETEVHGLGLGQFSLAVRGGAHLRFADDGSLLIWGQSEEFGACNYREVMRLLKTHWPDREIACFWGEIS